MRNDHHNVIRFHRDGIARYACDRHRHSDINHWYAHWKRSVLPLRSNRFSHAVYLHLEPRRVSCVSVSYGHLSSRIAFDGRLLLLGGCLYP
jgi:hypothetical protein